MGGPKDVEPHGLAHVGWPGIGETLQSSQQARHQSEEGSPPRGLIQVHHEHRAQRRRPQNQGDCYEKHNFVNPLCRCILNAGFCLETAVDRV